MRKCERQRMAFKKEQTRSKHKETARTRELHVGQKESSGDREL
jgi:hypothetical protein